MSEPMIMFLKVKCYLDEKQSADSGIAVYVGSFVGTEISVEITADYERPRLGEELPVECRAWVTVTGTNVVHPEWASGYGFTLRARGVSLAECEKNMLAEIGKLRRLFGIFCIHAQAPADIAEACANFIRRWGELPPLIRAGYGDGMIQRALQEIAERAYLRPAQEMAEYNRLLPRRNRVHQLFGVASRIVCDLAIALTQQADDEAEAQGFDQDVRYDLAEAPARD